MVKEGEVSSDSYGSAKLPFAYGFTSSNGKIHIYQNNEGRNCRYVLGILRNVKRNGGIDIC